jgi:L-rhamnose mutarotase
MDVSEPTTRHCFVLDLHDDPELIAGYERWHRPGGPPVAITRSIRQAGIAALEIWRAGPRLFMILEAGPDYDAARKAEQDATDPDVIAWEQLMWQFQRPVAWAAPGEKWAAAARIYALAEQPDPPVAAPSA